MFAPIRKYQFPVSPFLDDLEGYSDRSLIRRAPYRGQEIRERRFYSPSLLHVRLETVYKHLLYRPVMLPIQTAVSLRRLLETSGVITPGCAVFFFFAREHVPGIDFASTECLARTRSGKGGRKGPPLSALHFCATFHTALAVCRLRKRASRNATKLLRANGQPEHRVPPCNPFWLNSQVNSTLLEPYSFCRVNWCRKLRDFLAVSRVKCYRIIIANDSGSIKLQ